MGSIVISPCFLVIAYIGKISCALMAVMVMCKVCEHTIYQEECKAMQLRYWIRSKVNNNYPTNNFGLVKGKSFDHVLIYPTEKMLDFLLNGTVIENPEIKAKLYVAITRARYSVGIVYDYPEDYKHKLNLIRTYK